MGQKPRTLDVETVEYDVSALNRGELFAPINFEKATTNGETPTIDQPMA